MPRGLSRFEPLEPRVLFGAPHVYRYVQRSWPCLCGLLRAGQKHGPGSGGRLVQYISGKAVIDVEIDFTTDAIRADSRPALRLTGKYDKKHPIAWSRALEKLTGLINSHDASTPDMYIRFGDAFLKNQLWFDPDPAARTAPPAANKTDATTVILHELGHGLGFYGDRDGMSGNLTGPETPYDALQIRRNGVYYFAGRIATAWYEGDVPLTFQNINHVGNLSRGPEAIFYPI